MKVKFISLILLLVACKGSPEIKSEIPRVTEKESKDGKYSNLSAAEEVPSLVLELSLREKGYSEIPVNIFGFNNLRRLDLSMNPIEGIPKEIERLKNLEVLIIGHAQIETIDNALAGLPNLSVVSLPYNNIGSIPESLCTSNIERLNLSENPITEIPKCFCSTPIKMIPNCTE